MILCIVVNLLLQGTKIVKAQTVTSNDSAKVGRIEWVSEFPSENKRPKSGFFNRLGDLIFGGKNVPISKPVSVLAVNPDKFFVLDQKHGTISQIDNMEATNLKIRNKKSEHFNSLVAICAIQENEILFTDSYLNRIFRITPGKKDLRIINDSLVLEQPTGVAFSKVNDEIWVVETHGHRITVLDIHGKVKKHIGSRGTGPGEFNFPTHIWIDDNGTAYIVDAMNFRVQIFDRNCEFESAFGEQGDATGYFAMPKGIATDSYGNIYVADALFHTIQIFDRSGNFLYNFGGQGREQGHFWMPSGIYIDDNDFIYVADSYNSRVQIFQLIMGDK